MVKLQSGPWFFRFSLFLTLFIFIYKHVINDMLSFFEIGFLMHIHLSDLVNCFRIVLLVYYLLCFQFWVATVALCKEWFQWGSCKLIFVTFFLLLCRFVLFLLIMEANYCYWLIATSPPFFWYSVTFLLPEFLFTMRMTPCK